MSVIDITAYRYDVKKSVGTGSRCNVTGTFDVITSGRRSVMKSSLGKRLDTTESVGDDVTIHIYIQ